MQLQHSLNAAPGGYAAVGCKLNYDEVPKRCAAARASLRRHRGSSGGSLQAAVAVQAPHCQVSHHLTLVMCGQVGSTFTAQHANRRSTGSRPPLEGIEFGSSLTACRGLPLDHNGPSPAGCHDGDPRPWSTRYRNHLALGAAGSGCSLRRWSLCRCRGCCGCGHHYRLRCSQDHCGSRLPGEGDGLGQTRGHGPVSAR